MPQFETASPQFRLSEYPPSEPQEALWLRLSLISTLAARELRFFWEPLTATPELLRAYTNKLGIEASLTGLTYLFVGERSAPHDDAPLQLGSDFRDGDEPAIIPIVATSLANYLRQICCGGRGELKSTANTFSVVLSEKREIIAKVVMQETRMGVRSVVSLAEYDVPSVELARILPSTSDRQMEVSDSGTVFYCKRPLHRNAVSALANKLFGKIVR